MELRTSWTKLNIKLIISVYEILTEIFYCSTTFDIISVYSPSESPYIETQKMLVQNCENIQICSMSILDRHHVWRSLDPTPDISKDFVKEKKAFRLHFFFFCIFLFYSKRRIVCNLACNYRLQLSLAIIAWNYSLQLLLGTIVCNYC